MAILYGEVFLSPLSHFGSKYFEAGQHPRFYSIEYGSVPRGAPLVTPYPCVSSIFTRKSILHPAQLAEEAVTPYLPTAQKSGPQAQVWK